AAAGVTVAHVLELPAKQRQGVRRPLAELAHDRRLEPRVHLAVVALRVAAALPVVPVDAAEEVLPRAVVLALDQIAGALPALRRVGRVAPRRARVLALAGGELEEERRRGDLLVALGQLDD